MILSPPVVGVGWKESRPKASPILVVYFGNDVERATDEVNAALDNGSLTVGYVLRGQQPFAGQLMYAATTDNRPAPVGRLEPATGK
jgi:hypothetical protein